MQNSFIRPFLIGLALTSACAPTIYADNSFRVFIDHLGGFFSANKTGAALTTVLIFGGGAAACHFGKPVIAKYWPGKKSSRRTIAGNGIHNEVTYQKKSAEKLALEEQLKQVKSNRTTLSEAYVKQEEEIDTLKKAALTGTSTGDVETLRAFGNQNIVDMSNDRIADGAELDQEIADLQAQIDLVDAELKAYNKTKDAIKAERQTTETLLTGKSALDLQRLKILAARYWNSPESLLAECKALVEKYSPKPVATDNDSENASTSSMTFVIDNQNKNNEDEDLDENFA